MFIEQAKARGQSSRAMDGQPDKPEVIGERLRIARLAMGYEDQVAFALRCGVSSQAWNNWERGRQPPSLDQASRIRARTGLTTDFIYYGDLRGLAQDLADKIQKVLDAEQLQRRA